MTHFNLSSTKQRQGEKPVSQHFMKFYHIFYLLSIDVNKKRLELNSFGKLDFSKANESTRFLIQHKIMASTDLLLMIV